MVKSIFHVSSNWVPLWVGLSGNLTDFLGPLFKAWGDGSSVARDVCGQVPVGLWVGVGLVSVYITGFLVLKKLVAVGCVL